MLTDKLHNIILNCSQPVVIKNYPLPWKCFGESFKDFADTFDAEHTDGVIFETTQHKYGDDKQWESTRGNLKMTMNEFLEKSDNEGFNGKAACFNYKNKLEIPRKCTEGVNFKELGFPDDENLTFWVGSPHSHTPCHQDTYGINIVAQVFGRKSWILFPPTCNIKSTRSPYEESSIYTKENFFSPGNYSQFLDIENEAYHVILEKGDILIVPKHWFHYVECLETSMNFNLWIKLESDVDAQIDECLSKILLKSFLDDADENLLTSVVNPNEIQAFLEDDTDKLQRTLNHLISLQTNPKRTKLDNTFVTNFLTKEQLNKLFHETSDHVIKVQKMESYEFFAFMKLQMQNFDKNCKIKESFISTKNLIDKTCDRKCLNLIKSSMLTH